eukprot:1394945-Rhodomonas_salina.2
MVVDMPCLARSSLSLSDGQEQHLFCHIYQTLTPQARNFECPEDAGTFSACCSNETACVDAQPRVQEQSARPLVLTGQTMIMPARSPVHGSTRLLLMGSAHAEGSDSGLALVLADDLAHQLPRQHTEPRDHPQKMLPGRRLLLSIGASQSWTQTTCCHRRARPSRSTTLAGIKALVHHAQRTTEGSGKCVGSVWEVRSRGGKDVRRVWEGCGKGWYLAVEDREPVEDHLPDALAELEDNLGTLCQRRVLVLHPGPHLAPQRPQQVLHSPLRRALPFLSASAGQHHNLTRVFRTCSGDGGRQRCDAADRGHYIPA